MPLGKPELVNAQVALAVAAEYDEQEGHDGAYRRYCELMAREPGSPMVCGWIDFVAWWEAHKQGRA